MVFLNYLKERVLLICGFFLSFQNAIPSREVVLIIISTVFSGIGIFAYQEYQKYQKEPEVNIDDKLALSLVEREKDLGIYEIKETPSWFRESIVSLYAENIHDTMSRRDNSFTRKVRDFLVLRFVDLNRDTIPEVMINYSGITLCGNKDCPTDIYEILPQEKMLRKIGGVTPRAYKIFDVAYSDYNGYTLIVNCIYGDGGVALLVYSLDKTKYEEKRVLEETVYGDGQGCKFFDNDRLNLSEEMVKSTIRSSTKE